MKRKSTIWLGLIALLLGSGPAMAFVSYFDTFNSAYPATVSNTGTNASCSVCHSTTAGGGALNGYGRDFANTGIRTTQAFLNIEALNSDGDPTGASNIAEINASTQPGWTPGAVNTFYGVFTRLVTNTNQNPPPSIGILDPNRPPVLSLIGARSVNEGQPLTFAATATDPDGNALTFSAVNLPLGATLSSSGVFAWTPSFTQGGNNYNVTITVTDNGSPARSDSETFTITVGNVNRPPVLSPIGARSVNEGQPLTFAATATDPDGNALTFSAVNLPLGATLSSSGVFAWTPSFTQSGNVNVTITVTDNGSPLLSDFEVVTITVSNVNRPPVLSLIGARSVNEGQLLTFTATATDPDGNALTFSSGNLPTGATLNTTTGVFAWTPSFTQGGIIYNVTITVTDNGSLSDSEVVTITVGNVNQPPVLSPIGPRSVNEGQPLTFTATATDPDGNALTFSAGNLPTGATLSPSGVFAWTPSSTQGGNYNVTITVTDNGSPAQSDSEVVTITVGNVNQPPVLSLIGAQSVNEGQLLTFTATATDPDGNALTFSAGTLPTGATLSPSGVFAWTPSFTQGGNYTVTITVTDNGSPPQSDSETFTIIVGNVNRPPELSLIGAQSVNEGLLLTFTATATDPDINALTFSAGNLPTGATLSPSGVFAWTPSFTQGGNYNVTITVTDNGIPAQSDFEVVTITVGNVNRPPVLGAVGASQTATEGQLKTIPISATDPDGDGVTFAGSNLPTGATLTDNLGGTATFAWTPSLTQAGSYPNVTITVTDNGSPPQSASAQFTITVLGANQPPVLAPIGAQTTSVGQLLAFSATATDPDSSVLTFSAGNLPVGARFTSAGAFSWTPTAGQTGNHSGVTITVTDNGSPPQTDSETFTITVGSINRPPLLNTIGARSVDEGLALTFMATGSDPDGDTLTFASANLPTGATLTPMGAFSWTPSFAQAGNYSVTISVSDGALSASETFTITVGNVNRPPVLSPSPIGNRTLSVGQMLMIAITASDADGDALTFSSANLPTGATLTPSGPGAATFSWTPAATQTGSFANVTITVSDGALNDAEIFTITVAGTNANLPPVVTNPGSKTVTEGQLLSFVIVGADPNGDVLSFASANLPGGATLSPAGAFTWTPVAGQAGSYSVTVTATDNGSPALTSAPQTFVITVLVPRPGDIDGDGDVDSDDLNLILAARNTLANGPNDLRDLNGDGKIDALDSRKLVTLCTRPRCATR